MNYFFISIFGLIAGSFSSYITYRMGKGKDLLFSYSKCVNCNSRLKFYNLIPLFSFIFQKGRCSICKNRVSRRYVAIEIFFLSIFNYILFFNNGVVDHNLIFILIFATIFAMIAIVDLEYYFIPDALQVTLLLVIGIFMIFNAIDLNDIFKSLTSAILYLSFALFLHLSFLWVLKKEAIGVDDIKLFFCVGMLIGIEKFVDFAFFCGFFGVVFGSVWQKIKNDDTFPFAPSILTSCFLCFIMGVEYSMMEYLMVYFIEFIL